MNAVDVQSLRLEKICFGYDDAPLFSDFSFELPPDRLVWLKSAPGAGKSSLLKIFSGLLTPASGRYFVNDVDVLELSFKEFLPYRFAFGYSFDMFGLLANRTIRDNLLLPLLYHRLCSSQEAHERVDFWMERFDLARCARQRPFAVTGSQRKTTIVLRSMIHRPQIAFLDDPMAGFKLEGQKAFADFVEDAHANHGLKQIIFSSERTLPLHSTPAKEVFFSHRAKSEVA